MIVLHNDGHGFGFGISGSRNSGAVVRNIFPGGAADRVRYFFTGGNFYIFFKNIKILLSQNFVQKSNIVLENKV